MINLNWEFDEKKAKELIKASKDLEKDNEVFANLAQVAEIKKQFNEMADVVEALDRELKMAINDRAKTLYGHDWAVIAGDGYKISRSGAGPVYELIGKAPKKFTKITVKPDGKEIGEYIRTHDGKLPTGIAFNKNRGESIRITLNGS